MKSIATHSLLLNSFLFYLLTSLMSFCLIFSSFAAASDSRLSLTGSSTIAPLALEIAKRYEKLYPGTRIDVQTGGSSRGINDTRTRIADIGMVSRSLTSIETDLTSHLIAIDGIGIIVHRDNPITHLGNTEIIAIYTGKITNWQDLGGANLPITVVNKAEGRSTLELFLQYFSLKNSQVKAQVVIGDNQQGIKTVAANPGAIGYVSIGTAEYEENQGTPIRRLPLADVPATTEQVSNGQYPLSRKLNFVVIEPSENLTKKFIHFAKSADVYDLIEGLFFVPAH